MSEYNGYELSRRFWDWAFRHQDYRNPSHAALYGWFVEYANRMGWPASFEMAPQYAMTAIGVSSYNTYKKVLADLVGVGFITVVREGRNQYAPCLIALSKNDKALNENYCIPKPVAADASSKNDKAKSRGLSKNDKARDTPTENALSSGVSNFDKARDRPRDRPRDAITINNKPINLNLNKTTREKSRPPFWSVLTCSVDEYETWLRAEQKKTYVTWPASWSAAMIALYTRKWLPFRQNTKTFRKKLGADSIQQQINALADLTADQLDACITNSTANAYQGLFPEKFKRHAQNPVTQPTNAYGQGAILPAGTSYRKQSIGRSPVGTARNTDPVT